MPITPVPCATESAGEIIIPPIEVELNCATDSVTICPGDDPIVVEGTVALDATTLVALETITVLQGTSPWVVNVGNFPAGGTGLTDAELRATPVPVSGTVTVNEPVTVDGIVALDVASLAALETIELGATTLAALETIAVTGPLTDAQLRATPVPVSGSLTVNEPVTVDGTVALDAGSLAALETITALQGTSPWVVDSTTLATEATLARRFGISGRTTEAFAISASGDNVIVDPAPGLKVRVYWVGLSVASADEVVATLKFGVAGTAKYIWNLGAFMHWETIEGAVDENLIVNLSATVATKVNITFETL